MAAAVRASERETERARGRRSGEADRRREGSLEEGEKEEKDGAVA